MERGMPAGCPAQNGLCPSGAPAKPPFRLCGERRGKGMEHGMPAGCPVRNGLCPDAGAGDGNRTHATSLEGWDSTIELHPQEDASANVSLDMIAQTPPLVNPPEQKSAESPVSLLCLPRFVSKSDAKTGRQAATPARWPPHQLQVGKGLRTRH